MRMVKLLAVSSNLSFHVWRGIILVTDKISIKKFSVKCVLLILCKYKPNRGKKKPECFLEKLFYIEELNVNALKLHLIKAMAWDKNPSALFPFSHSIFFRHQRVCLFTDLLMLSIYFCLIYFSFGLLHFYWAYVNLIWQSQQKVFSSFWGIKCNDVT